MNPKVFSEHRGVLVWVIGITPDIQVFYYDPVSRVERGFVIDVLAPSLVWLIQAQIDQILHTPETRTRLLTPDQQHEAVKEIDAKMKEGVC